jgi:hypothetical protein
MAKVISAAFIDSVTSLDKVIRASTSSLSIECFEDKEGKAALVSLQTEAL